MWVPHLLLDRMPTFSSPNIYNNTSDKVSFLNISKTLMLSEWQGRFAWRVFRGMFAWGFLANWYTEIIDLLTNFASVSLIYALVSLCTDCSKHSCCILKGYCPCLLTCFCKSFQNVQDSWDSLESYWALIGSEWCEKRQRLYLEHVQSASPGNLAMFSPLLDYLWVSSS